MKLFIGILWGVCLLASVTYAVYNYHTGETIEAIYFILIAIFLLLCIKD